MAKFDAVDPDYRDEQDPGYSTLYGDPQQVGEERDHRQVHHQQYDVADVHAGDDRPDDLRVFLEQQRARIEPVDHQSAEQDAAGARPGMPRVSNGIIAPPVSELLAASGAATPSIAPLPKLSGCFDVRFATR